MKVHTMFKKILVTLGLMGAFAVTFSAQTSAIPAVSQVAQVGNPRCAPRLLTFPVWYRGLPNADMCNPQVTQFSHLWVIGLNIIEILLQCVAYTTLGFIIWGGIRYSISTGDPSKISNAKDTITNAIVGFVIASASIAIVNFVVGL